MMSLFLLLILIPDIGNRISRYSEERQIYAAEIDSHEADDDRGETHGDHVDDHSHSEPNSSH